jgi:hypothetical protein
MNILFEELIAKVGRDVFKVAFGNDSLHEINRAINFRFETSNCQVEVLRVTHRVV